MLETLNRRLSGPSFVLSTVATHFPLSGGVWRFRVGLLGCWLVVLGGQAGVAFDDHVLIGWRADVAARPGCWLLEVSVMVVGSMLGGPAGLVGARRLELAGINLFMGWRGWQGLFPWTRIRLLLLPRNCVCACIAVFALRTLGYW